MRPHVYNSIRSNLVGGLNAHVDLVAIMSLRNPPPKLHSWASPPSDAAVSKAALARALSTIKPRAVVLDESRDDGEGGGAYGTVFNPRCTTPHGFMGSDAHGSRQQVMRTVAQPASWSVCLDILEGFERADGAQYAFIVRSRPDAWWFRPHPAASCLSPRVVYVHDWLDMHFVLPRDAAPTIMRGMAEQYSACNGTFPHAALEAWLRHAVGQLVLASHDRTGLTSPSSTEPLRVAQLIFPFALVRNDSKQSDAWWWCGRNVDAYSFSSGSKHSRPGSENGAGEHVGGESCNDVRRRLASGLLSCTRRAYPEETIPAGYHSSQLWSWFLRGMMGVVEGSHAQADRARRLLCASPSKGASKSASKSSDLQVEQSGASNEHAEASSDDEQTAPSGEQRPSADTSVQAATAMSLPTTPPPFSFYVHLRDANSTEGACWTYWSAQTFAALLKHPWRSRSRSRAAVAFVEVESRFEVNYPLFERPRNG